MIGAEIKKYKKNKEYYLELLDQYEANQEIMNSLYEKSPYLQSDNGLKDAVNETSTKLYGIAYEDFVTNTYMYCKIMDDISETQNVLSEIERKFGPSARTLIENLYIKKLPETTVAEKFGINIRTIKRRVDRYLREVLS